MTLAVWSCVIGDNKTPCLSRPGRKEDVRQRPHQTRKFTVSMQRLRRLPAITSKETDAGERGGVFGNYRTDRERHI